MKERQSERKGEWPVLDENVFEHEKSQTKGHHNPQRLCPFVLNVSPASPHHPLEGESNLIFSFNRLYYGSTRL